MAGWAAAMSNRSPGSAARSNSSGGVCTVRSPPWAYAPLVMKCALNLSFRTARNSLSE